MDKNTTSFWKFIQDHPIEVPIIQRDYVQGRIGKEHLRKVFLSNIKHALDDHLSDTGKVLKLDFVYGSEERGKLHPLVGQQRLTTLWLLHWYIALRVGLLEEVCGTLKKFTYETRISSREFCENLCQCKNFEEYKDEEHIVDFITNRTWFYSSWEQDPTIQSILNMLGGTKVTNKQDKNIIDSIEKLFKNTDKENLRKYWNCLVSENAPIIFYYLPLKDFALSDDLYIKMNARGKQLTAFENFKADLIGYIQERIRENEEWEELDDVPIKMDTVWTDVFWQNHKNGKIDEIYFAFINRYFLNCAIVYANAKKEDSEVWKLYGNESDDSALSYDTGFGIYSDILTQAKKRRNVSILLRLKRLFEKITTNENINKYLPQWFSKFDFIPKYKKDNRGNLSLDNSGNIYKISTLTQPQRVAFFGICRYFEQCDSFNEVHFKRWMRVVCNLVGNSTIDTIDAMIARIKLIDELSGHIEDIYEFLADENSGIESKASPEQLSEEVEKAKQILFRHNNPELPEQEKNRDNCHDWNWEAVILEAENYAFFHGAIRFLFKNDEDNVEWIDFEEKWKNARLIFTNGGLTEEYKKSAKANRIILSYCRNWEAQIQSYTRNDKYIFGFSSQIWRDNILLKKGTAANSLLYAESIHHLLMGDGVNESLQLDDTDDYRQIAFEKLVNTNVIEWAQKKQNTDWNYVRWIYDGLSLYPSREGVILTKSHRDSILNTLIDNGTITLVIGSQIDTKPEKMLYGWDIKFQYKKDGVCYLFQWQHWDKIYMYEGDFRLYDNEKLREQNLKLVIDENKVKDANDFVQAMNECIESYLQSNKYD